MTTDKLAPEILGELIASVGSHRGKRPFSPVEVANYFQSAIDNGIKKAELADMVLLSTSMVDRIRKLLLLPSEIRLLVDWGASDVTITMSTAYELSRLKDRTSMRELSEGVIEHRMTKGETQEVVQLVSFQGISLSQAIADTVKSRPTIVKQLVFIGDVTDSYVSERLRTMTQAERDEFFSELLNQLLSASLSYSCRLSHERFVVSGSELLQRELSALPQNFETLFNGLIEQRLMND